MASFLKRYCGGDYIGYTDAYHSQNNNSASKKRRREESPVKSANTPYEWNILWDMVFIFSIMHIGSAIGIFLMVNEGKWQTWAWMISLHIIGATGVTAGAHRLWTHRAYKAKLPLRILLVSMSSIAFQDHVMEWTQQHRSHHKWSETDADPHNAKRGLFFSHIGWLLIEKHPEVLRKGKTVDMSDIYADPVLVFQRKYHLLFGLFFCFFMPTFVPWYFWEQDLITSFLGPSILRFCFTLHCTWCVNSIAHAFGPRPYDKNISPSENLLTSAFAMGEGWHNYHHAFPYDYKAAELPYNFNLTTLFIDFFAKIGLAYDLKQVSEQGIANQKTRCGEKFE